MKNVVLICCISSNINELSHINSDKMLSDIKKKYTYKYDPILPPPSFTLKDTKQEQFNKKQNKFRALQYKKK